MIKEVADAICRADGHNPDYVSWIDYKDHARAALDVMGVEDLTEKLAIARQALNDASVVMLRGSGLTVGDRLAVQEAWRASDPSAAKS